MPKRIQSPSSINTYKQCPRRYYYQYILEWPTRASIHLLRGNIVHSVLEDFFRLDFAEAEKDLHHATFLQRTALQLLHYHWGSRKTELDKLGLLPEQLAWYLDESKLMLLNWLQHFIKRLENEIKKGYSLDQAFERLVPVREKEYQSEMHGIRGFIDAIEEIDGEVKLIDYKTSRKSEITPAYRLQLAIYALLYKLEHGKMPEKAGVWFLNDREKIIQVDEELLKEALFEIEQIHASTESSNMADYPKKPCALCKWSGGQCDFYEQCRPF